MPPRKEKSSKTDTVPVSSKSTDAMGLSTRAATRTFHFLQNSYKEYPFYMLKANLLSTVSSMVIFAVFAILGLFVAIAGFSFASNNPMTDIATLLSGPSLPVIILVGLLLAIGTFLATAVSTAVEFAMIVGTRERMEQSPPSSILAVTKANFVPAAKYTAIFVAILLFFLLLAFGVPVAAVGILKINPVATLAVFLLFSLLGILLLVIVSFFIQFAFWELAVRKRGVVESLRASIALVKRNIVAVFLFDIVLLAIGFAVGSALSFLSYIIQFVVSILVVVLPLAGLVIAVLLGVAYLVAQSVLIYTIVFPFTHAFWKSLSVK